MNYGYMVQRSLNHILDEIMQWSKFYQVTFSFQC
jgi:hypothetical protein